MASGSRSLRSAAEERAINNVVANAMAEAFNPRSSDALRAAADGVLKVSVPCQPVYAFLCENFKRFQKIYNRCIMKDLTRVTSRFPKRIG